MSSTKEVDIDSAATTAEYVMKEHDPTLVKHEESQSTELRKPDMESQESGFLELLSPPKRVKRELSASNSTSPKEKYDFESKGIEAEKVEAKDLLEPSRSIATLQIARDLRNDSAVQLSSLLTALPEDIRRTCAAASEQEGEYELEDSQARDFSERINGALLDIDLDEERLNIRTFQNIVFQQRKAREQLIRVLIRSRCKFEAVEAADAFYAADRAQGELKKRKLILLDAMELEGIDPDDGKLCKISGISEEELILLPWYSPHGTAADD